MDKRHSFYCTDADGDFASLHYIPEMKQWLLEAGEDSVVYLDSVISMLREAGFTVAYPENMDE